MMKNMILPIAFTALIASMTACSDETDPILTQKAHRVLLCRGKRP